MSHTHFKLQQIEFLINNIINPSIRSKFIQGLQEGRVYKNGHATDCYLITFSSKEREAMLDELSFPITSIGLDGHGEVNKQGLIIEELIDLFCNGS